MTSTSYKGPYRSAVATEVPFAASRASVALDAIRGVAALVVTLEHLRYRLFLVFTPEDLSDPFLHALAILSEFGHSAVIVFFVLSGFLVGGSLLRAHRSDRWSWISYLTHRLVRLWIVLLPGLLIGCIWDLATIHFGQRTLHSPEAAARIAQVSQSLTFMGFWANMAFLQDLVLPIFGSNGPLWSLSYEFWYYILFPLGFYALVPRYSPAVRIMLLALTILLSFALHSPIMMDAPIWLAGAALFFLPQLRCGGKLRLAALGVFLILNPVLLRLSFRRPVLADYLLAATVVLTVWILLSSREAADPAAFGNRLFRLLARFSFTLYLIHVPIFTFVGVYLIRHPWRPTPPHILFAAAVWLLTILFAWAVASLTEFRTDQVRRFVEVASQRATRSDTSAVSQRSTNA